VPHARRIFGDAGEHLAERALLGRGWRILARNARTRYGEIDLVCHDGHGYVFVEVKTRRAGSFVPAIEAVGPRKLDRLVRLAEAWLALQGRRTAPWRLVLAALTVGPAGTETRIIDIVE
jgi:putative endonuclease